MKILTVSSAINCEGKTREIIFVKQCFIVSDSQRIGKNLKSKTKKIFFLSPKAIKINKKGLFLSSVINMPPLYSFFEDLGMLFKYKI